MQVHRTNSVASCLACLPVHPGMTGRSCHTTANWHRHPHTGQATHTHTHSHTHTHPECDPPLLAISHTCVVQELRRTEVTQAVHPIHLVADL